jgi:hypothetical protein
MMPEQDHEQDPDNLPPGTALCGGRFVIEACVGRGGVATVYRVRTADERRLALKLMVTRRAADGDQRERFENEWRILKALRGLPYVVAVDSSGRHDDGRPFFTMELVEAPTLADLIAERDVTVARACWVMREVAHALDDLHTRGVVHRDIKPDNIMVAPDRVRLLDFGYAYTRGSEQLPPTAGLTSADHRPGTPLYMAPEQVEGELPTPAFDIYAHAATLYEALVGHAPYSDLPAKMMLLHKCRGADGEPSIEGRMVGLRKGLVRLIDQGLRRKPSERVASAAELRDRLDAVLEEMGDEDFPAGAPERPAHAAGEIEDRDADVTMAFLPARPRPEAPEPGRVHPLRPAIGGGRGETMPVPAATAAEPALEVPEDLQVVEPTDPELDEKAELLALREAARRSAEQAEAARQEAARSEAARRDEAIRAEAARAEAARAEAARREAAIAVARPGASEADPAGGSAAIKWIAAAAVLLLLGGGAWWGLSPGSGRDALPPVAGEPTSVEVQPAAEATPETKAAATAEVEGEVEGEVEAAPAPKPELAPPVPSQPEAPSKPDKGRRKGKAPRSPDSTPAVEEPCTDVAAEAKAASRDKQWSRVLKLTKSTRCWTDTAARNRLRANALLESGQLAECVKLGATDSQPEVQRIVKRCAKQLEEGTP